jgi:hypothetical protein
MPGGTVARVVVGLLAAVVLAGCGGDRPATSRTAAAPTTAATPSTVAAPVRPVTLADAKRCPVTRPSRFRPPPGVARDALFGAASAHGNGKLWGVGWGTRA